MGSQTPASSDKGSKSGTSTPDSAVVGDEAADDVLHQEMFNFEDSINLKRKGLEEQQEKGEENQQKGKEEKDKETGG